MSESNDSDAKEARLSSIEQKSSPPMPIFDRLVAEGKITLAKTPQHPLPTPRPLLPGEEPLSETLRKMREEERY